MTLCLPKPGLLTERGLQVAGEVWVVDIGIPNQVYAGAGIDPPGRSWPSRTSYGWPTSGTACRRSDALRSNATDCGPKSPHAAQPAVVVGGLALEVSCDLGMGEDQEAFLGEAGHH